MDFTIKAVPFSWNDNLSEVAREDFSMIQKSLSYGTAQSIGMALAKLELLEKQGCEVIETKHGRWTGADGYSCSECGESYMEVADADAYASGWKPNYCPNCGAKMQTTE